MSGLKRFFVKEINGDIIELVGDEFNHAANVLRLKEGEQVVLSDNSGYDYTAEIRSVAKKQMTLCVIDKQKNDKEAKTRVTLICGFLKGDKTELVVQKATELGVANIIVFDSAFSSAYVSDNKIERLRRVAEEAAKQCGRATYPTVEYMPFQQAILACKDIKNKIFACEFETETSLTLSSLSGETAVCIGSEGGFNEEERAFAVEAGFASVSLGKRILRAETASIALLSVVFYSLGEWQR